MRDVEFTSVFIPPATISFVIAGLFHCTGHPVKIVGAFEVNSFTRFFLMLNPIYTSAKLNFIVTR